MNRRELIIAAEKECPKRKARKPHEICAEACRKYS